MAFFSDKVGRLYPISEIVKVVPSGCYKANNEGKRPPSKVHLRGEEDYPIEIEDYMVAEIEKTGAPTFGAQPGFYTLTYWHNSDEPDSPYLEEQPILGWRNIAGEGAMPIVLDDESINSSQLWAILRPDGKIVRAGDTTWDDRAAWEKSMKGEAEQRDQSKSTQAA